MNPHQQQQQQSEVNLTTSHTKRVTHKNILDQVEDCLANFDRSEQPITHQNWNDVLRNYRVALTQLNILYDYASPRDDDNLPRAIFPEHIPDQFRENVDALPRLLSVFTLDLTSNTEMGAGGGGTGEDAHTTNGGGGSVTSNDAMQLRNAKESVEQHNQRIKQLLDLYRKELIVQGKGASDVAGDREDVESSTPTSTTSSSGKKSKTKRKQSKKDKKRKGESVSSQLVIRSRESVAHDSKISKPTGKHAQLLALWDGKGVKAVVSKRASAAKSAKQATEEASTTVDPNSRAYFVEHFQKSQKAAPAASEVGLPSIPPTNAAPAANAGVSTAHGVKSEETAKIPPTSGAIDQKVQQRLRVKKQDGTPGKLLMTEKGLGSSPAATGQLTVNRGVDMKTTIKGQKAMPTGTQRSSSPTAQMLTTQATPPSRNLTSSPTAMKREPTANTTPKMQQASRTTPPPSSTPTARPTINNGVQRYAPYGPPIGGQSVPLNTQRVIKQPGGTPTNLGTHPSQLFNPTIDLTNQSQAVPAPNTAMNATGSVPRRQAPARATNPQTVMPQQMPPMVNYPVMMPNQPRTAAMGRGLPMGMSAAYNFGMAMPQYMRPFMMPNQAMPMMMPVPQQPPTQTPQANQPTQAKQQTAKKK